MGWSSGVRVLIAILSLLVTLLMVAEASYAELEDHQTPRPGAKVRDGVPEAVVVRGPGEREVASARTGGRRGTWTCRYYALLGAQGGAPSGVGPDLVAGAVAPVDGEPYVLLCRDADEQVVRSEILVYRAADPLGGIAAAYRAAEQARTQLPLAPPGIGTSPPAGAPLLVGLPTWLWVDTPWAAQQRSASLGGVTSTVTATPVEVRWEPGDGASLVCRGPGVAFDPARPGAATDCTHTYQRSSRHRPGGRYDVIATVTWQVSWQASTGEAGDLEPVSLTSQLPVTVLEAQAVID